MSNLYMVKTHNRHKQVLLFKSKVKAITWLVKVMRNDLLTKAIQDIQKIPVDHLGAFNLYGVDQDE